MTDTQTKKQRKTQSEPGYPKAADYYGRSRSKNKPTGPTAASLRNPKRRVADSKPV